MGDRPDFLKLFEEKYQGAQGKSEPLPHFTPLSHAAFLDVLASGGHSLDGRFGHARLPGETGYASWTMFYLTRTQGGAYTGEGYLVRYGSGNPTTGRFSICNHQIVADSSREEQMRGDHRQHCKLCGMSLSYDSSD
jgi:hypothetical protein